MVLVFGVIL